MSRIRFWPLLVVFACLSGLLAPGAALARAPQGDPALLTPAGTTPVAAAQEKILYTYVIRPGDTLWDIAKWVLKNPFLWPELLKYNYIGNPDLIFPGDKLTVPSLEVLERVREARDADEIEAIRRESESRAREVELQAPGPATAEGAAQPPLPGGPLPEGLPPLPEGVRVPAVEPDGGTLPASELKITGRKSMNFNYREYRGGVSPYYFSSGYTRQESLNLTVSGQIDKTVKVEGLFYQSDQELESKSSLSLSTQNVELFLGDFSAALPDTEFMLRDRALSGGRLTADFKTFGGVLAAGAAKGRAQYERFYGNRTQGPYYLKQAPVVFGSERILLNKRPVLRGTDYLIDYYTGQLTFLRQSVDDITLVEAVYEARQTVFARSLYAGRVWAKPWSWLRVAGSAVREADPESAGVVELASGDTLTPMGQWNIGADLAAEVPGYGTLAGEWAGSRYQSDLTHGGETAGQAVKAETRGSLGPLGVIGYYRRTTPEFRMAGGTELGTDLLNYGGGLDVKTGGPYALAGDYDFKDQILAGTRQLAEQAAGQAGFRPFPNSALGYQYFQLRESNDAPGTQHLDYLTRRHSGALEIGREYWDAGLRAEQETRSGQLADRDSAVTRGLGLSAGSRNLKWMSLNGAADCQIVDAGETSVAAAGVYRVVKAQVTGSLTPSERFALTADNRWVWDERYGPARTLDTKFRAAPFNALRAEAKYAWETLQSLVGSAYLPVYTQTGAGQVEVVPLPQVSLRISPSLRWSSLADGGRTLNLNRTDQADLKWAMAVPVSHALEIRRDLYWLADTTAPDLRIQTEQENRKGGYSLRATLSGSLSAEADMAYEQYYKNNYSLSLNGYEHLTGRRRTFALALRSSLREVLRVEGKYALDFRDQDGSGPQSVTRAAYPISVIGQTTAQYDLLNSYGSLHSRQDTASARVTYQWTEAFSAFAEGTYDRNEDVSGREPAIHTAAPALGAAWRWAALRAEVGTKWARSWGGAETRQEAYSLAVTYNPLAVLSLALRAQHSRTTAPDALTTEANLNCSLQF